MLSSANRYETGVSIFKCTSAELARLKTESGFGTNAKVGLDKMGKVVLYKGRSFILHPSETKRYKKNYGSQIVAYNNFDPKASKKYFLEICTSKFAQALKLEEQKNMPVKNETELAPTRSIDANETVLPQQATSVQGAAEPISQNIGKDKLAAELQLGTDALGENLPVKPNDSSTTSIVQTKATSISKPGQLKIGASISVFEKKIGEVKTQNQQAEENKEKKQAQVQHDSDTKKPDAENLPVKPNDSSTTSIFQTKATSISKPSTPGKLKMDNFSNLETLFGGVKTPHQQVVENKEKKQAQVQVQQAQVQHDSDTKKPDASKETIKVQVSAPGAIPPPPPPPLPLPPLLTVSGPAKSWGIVNANKPDQAERHVKLAKPQNVSQNNLQEELAARLAKRRKAE
ncbi:hypothetical protein [Iodobacter fluviatilis]|uniref:Uncharacterized protein n=1 Tax=Iodobacter fluviatilis TaxID=537 RepID=A0A377Q5X0_9NEIS|nr:hypothetical protein [Iodobacter fluviatilis]TCU80264.1 hypothetical protein EV682_1303 [Iodobacter fluviatilis]STQ90197.1 Uncharacterised protein [Iodobacter fluviatilis]